MAGVGLASVTSAVAESQEWLAAALEWGERSTASAEAAAALERGQQLWRMDPEERKVTQAREETQRLCRFLLLKELQRAGSL